MRIAHQDQATMIVRRLPIWRWCFGALFAALGLTIFALMAATGATVGGYAAGLTIVAVGVVQAAFAKRMVMVVDRAAGTLTVRSATFLAGSERVLRLCDIAGVRYLKRSYTEQVPRGGRATRVADVSTIILKDGAAASLDDETRPGGLLLPAWRSHDPDVDEAIAKYLGVPFKRGMRVD